MGWIEKSGNRAVTKRQLVNALLPLGNSSKFWLEVLRLGLVWVQSENLHQGFRAYTAKSDMVLLLVQLGES